MKHLKDHLNLNLSADLLKNKDMLTQQKITVALVMKNAKHTLEN